MGNRVLAFSYKKKTNVFLCRFISLWNNYTRVFVTKHVFNHDI